MEDRGTGQTSDEFFHKLLEARDLEQLLKLVPAAKAARVEVWLLQMLQHDM